MNSHDEKASCVFQHFTSRIGMQQGRDVTVDWDLIKLRRSDLQHLEEEFTEEEVKAVVQVIAPDKAPGPDGFIGVFTK